LEAETFTPAKAVRLSNIRPEPDVPLASRYTLYKATRIGKLQAAQKQYHNPSMFPRNKMAVIDTIDSLKPHAELVDVLVELTEKGRGREGEERLNRRWNS
jgi:hypothetical protein